ncbi:MAG: hypothetical protein IKX30_18360 [Victivallales bacterium]|nr:hypothetical protein [Victivallales bacterium]
MGVTRLAVVTSPMHAVNGGTPSLPRQRWLSTAGCRRYNACRQRRDAVVTKHAVNGETPSLYRVS